MKILYLLYHELRPAPSRYSYVLECSEFDRHCELFASSREPSNTGLIPEVTFDDGHQSNYEFALPILQRHQLRARFFITAGWTGYREGYMNWPEIRALHAAGQQIGAHGWSHKLLTHCTDAELDYELGHARRSLEDGLGAKVTTMSLPGGRMDKRVLDACWNAGYEEVFTSLPKSEPCERSKQSTVGRLNIHSGVNVPRLQQLLQSKTGTLEQLRRREQLKTFAKAMMGDRMYAALWAIVNRHELEADNPGAAPK